MTKIFRQIFYVDKDLSSPEKGWGWVEVSLEDAQRFGIKEEYPKSRRITKRKLAYDEKTGSVYEYFDHNYWINLPSRGKAGAKKFTLNINGELITIKAQKSLTNSAVCSWVRTWAPEGTKVITPGNRAYSHEGEKLAHQAHFVYFIQNEDSNAIKIGRARDLSKRMKALQTSSPAQLKLIKAIQVDSGKEAEALEKLLHQQFKQIRLAGEWFKAEAELLEFIQTQ